MSWEKLMSRARYMYWCRRVERRNVRVEPIGLHRRLPASSCTERDSEQKTNRHNLIKIDVDRHESDFLCGAKKTIRKFRPVLIIEMAQDCSWFAGSDIGLQLNDHDHVVCGHSTQCPFQPEMDFLFTYASYAYRVNVLEVHPLNCPKSVSL